MIDESTRKQLDSQDWAEIVPKLSDYAVMKVNKAFWRGGKEYLAGAKQIEDIVAGAIEATYRGERKWNHARVPDVVKFLKRVIDSDVSHLLKSYEHEHRDYAANSGHLLDDLDRAVAPDPADPGQDPLSEAIAGDLWQRLWESADGDEDMQSVLLCFEEGVADRSGIAEKLDWDLPRADKTLRRIRRHTKKCIEEQ